MAAPVIVAGALAAGAAIGGTAALAAKAGRNNREAMAYTRDQNASRWGGSEGGLNADRQYISGLGTDARNRDAYQANYVQANQDRQNALMARQRQDAAAQLMMKRATGQVPSIAEQQAVLQRSALGQEQASIAAGARGPAALAMAQQQRAAATAAGQGQIANAAQVNAAQERLAAEQAAFQAYSGMRGQDYGGQQLSASQAQFQAEMQQRNREAGDRASLGYEGMAQQATAAELQARTQAEIASQKAHTEHEQLEVERMQKNADREAHWVDKIIPSDVRAKEPTFMYSAMETKEPLAYGGGGAQQQQFSRLGSYSYDPNAVAQQNAARQQQADAQREMNNRTEMARIQGGFAADAQAAQTGVPDWKLGGGAAPAGGAGQGGNDAYGTAANMVSSYYGGSGGSSGGSGGGGGGGGNNTAQMASLASMFSDDRAKQPLALSYSDERTKTQPAAGVPPPSDTPVAQANRQYEASPYAYKDEFRPPEQAPGEPNVGPMAQTMAAHPVSGTAVRETPTGMLALDRDKALKLALAGVAENQRQQDELRLALTSKGGRAKRGKAA